MAESSAVRSGMAVRYSGSDRSCWESETVPGRARRPGQQRKRMRRFAFCTWFRVQGDRLQSSRKAGETQRVNLWADTEEPRRSAMIAAGLVRRTNPL